jgi:hypothetical protein
VCRILYNMIYHTYLSRSNSSYKKFIYILYIYILHIYIYTTFIYTLHLYIYYTIFSVEKCRDELGSPKTIPTRFYSLQGRNTPFWYTPKIGSGQNLLSRPDPTNSLIASDFSSFQLSQKRSKISDCIFLKIFIQTKTFLSYSSFVREIDI